MFTFSIYFVATQKVSPPSQYRMSLHSWLTYEIYRLFSYGFMDIKNFGFSASLACFGGLAQFGDIVYMQQVLSFKVTVLLITLWVNQATLFLALIYKETRMLGSIVSHLAIHDAHVYVYIWFNLTK